MDRTDMAGLGFAIAGVIPFARFALDPALTTMALFDALIGVGFLAIAGMMFRRERETVPNSGRSKTVLVIAVAAFLLGFLAYWVV